MGFTFLQDKWTILRIHYQAVTEVLSVFITVYFGRQQILSEGARDAPPEHVDVDVHVPGVHGPVLPVAGHLRGLLREELAVLGLRPAPVTVEDHHVLL